MRQNLFFGITFLALLIFLLLKLSVAPLPWYDEVYFRSVAEGWLEAGTFHSTIAPCLDTEIWIYGPIYFWLTAFSLDWFGSGIFQFRIVNFCAGLLLVFLFKHLVDTHYKINAKWSWVLALLFFLDPNFQSNLSCGRMDCVALFFILLSIYWLLKKEGSTQQGLVYLLAGIFAGFAILTTPRTGIFLIPISIVVVMYFIENLTFDWSIIGRTARAIVQPIRAYASDIKLRFQKNDTKRERVGFYALLFDVTERFSKRLDQFTQKLLKTETLKRLMHQPFITFSLFWFGLFFLYALWFFEVFGSVEKFLSIHEDGVDIFRFIGFKFKISLLFLPLLLIGFTVLVINFFKQKHFFFTKSLNTISFLSIVFFHGGVILASSKYLVLVLPFYYFLLANFLASDHKIKLNRIAKIGFSLLLVGYFLFFSLKNGAIMATNPYQEVEAFRTFIQKNIPEDSKVVGDYQFYEIIKTSNSHFFKPYHRQAENQEQCLREEINYDFLILDNRVKKEKDKKAIELYFENATLKEVAQYTPPKSDFVKKIKEYVPFISSYECVLYQRVK